MTLQLYFHPQAFPRSTTKEEWKEIWRWKRITQKELAKQLDEAMANFVCYGTTWPEHIRNDFMNNIINPPLLVHERQRQ